MMKQSLMIKPLTTTNFHDVFLFIEKSLGSHFSNNYEPFTQKCEIVFHGDKKTVITLRKKRSLDKYILTIESSTLSIVNGLVGYLNEVVDETSPNFTLSYDEEAFY